jgi:hypothetical protein
MAQLNTIEEIVDDLLLSRISRGDKAAMRAMGSTPGTFEEAYALTELGRWIRNFYGLWRDNELTKRWREEGPNDLRDGIDYSEDHPDNVSAKILDELFLELKAGR